MFLFIHVFLHSSVALTLFKIALSLCKTPDFSVLQNRRQCSEENDWREFYNHSEIWCFRDVILQLKKIKQFPRVFPEKCKGSSFRHIILRCRNIICSDALQTVHHFMSLLCFRYGRNEKSKYVTAAWGGIRRTRCSVNTSTSLRQPLTSKQDKSWNGRMEMIRSASSFV
jgi:hypothetical protein